MALITQKKLEKHLWDAANILRGSVDASEFKNYIFALLFLKRLNDVFEEECEKIAKLTGDLEAAWENPENHEFFIPLTARWNNLPREWYQDVSHDLYAAFKAIEEHNISLKGVLTTLNLSGGNSIPLETLIQLLNHFDQIKLRNCDLSDLDILGRAYEYLIKHFAEKGQKGGEFYTPRMVGILLVELLAPQKGMWICDPTVGSGGLLIQCVNYIKKAKEDIQTIKFFGQEKNPNTWAICKMNMIINGLKEAQIEQGDTIKNPKLKKDEHLLTFDIVIANPPFSYKNWGADYAERDPFHRFKFGIPPNNYGDLAFLQHMLSTMRPNGKMGIVLPHGILFRGGTEKKIRKALVESDLIEAIIGLPSNLFFGTTIPTCILILNKAKRVDRKRNILFLNASSLYKEGKNRNILEKKDVDKIILGYRSFKQIEGLSRIVPLKEIRDFRYNLNISLYVDEEEREELLDISNLASNIMDLEESYQRKNTFLMDFIKQIGSQVPNTSKKIPNTWYEGYLRDLIELETGKRAKGGALNKGTVVSIGGEHINERGQVIWKNIKYIPEDFYENLTQGKLRVNDILIVKDGATTGKCALVRHLPFDKVAVNEHVFIARPVDIQILDPEFLYHVLFSSIGQTQFKRRFHGIIGGINRSDLKSIKIPLPPIDEQRKIVKILSTIDGKLYLSQHILEETALMKKAMMQQLLRGRIRLGKLDLYKNQDT